MKDAPNTKQSERPATPAEGRAAQTARALVVAAAAVAATAATWAAQTAHSQTRFQTQAPAQPLDRIVAIVENEAVTERQLANNVQRARAVLARQNRAEPDERTLAGQVLQQMIVEQLQLQEARRVGINIDDITLDRTLTDTAKRNNLTLAEFKREVERGGENFQELRERMRKDLTLRRLVQREVIDRIQVSDQEIEDALADATVDSGSRGNETEYRLVRIHVPPQSSPEESSDESSEASPRASPALSPEARAAAEQRLVRVRRQLRDDSPASITDLRRHVARLWKADGEPEQATPPRYRVSDLGWRTAEALPPPVRRRVGVLRDGGVPVISNDDGVYLFHLLETRSGDPEMMQLQYRVRHILMRPNPVDDDEKIRRTLLDVKRRLEDGGDFRALACEYSEDPLSAMQGGKLGWSNLDNYVPEFAEAVRRARGKGDLVGPFQTAFGWHVLEVLGTREEDVGDDTLRRETITRIKQSKSEEETRLWLLRLRENRRIEIRV